MSASGPRERLCQFLKEDKMCRGFSDYIDASYSANVYGQGKQDLVVGFGMVSHQFGLSKGVPVDILNMLLTAVKVKRNVLGESGKIHILLGDHFAYACTHSSCQKPDDVSRLVGKYLKKISTILRKLGVIESCVFHLSSDIVNTSEYQAIREALDRNETGILHSENVSPDTEALIKCDDGKYNLSHKSYFLDQTAMFRYLYDYYGCGIKISWSRSGTRQNILKSRGFDEAHFDRFYRDMYPEESSRLSFIYTCPGYALEPVHQEKTEIPYTAPEKQVGRLLLSGKQKIDSSVSVNPKLKAAMTFNTEFVRSVVSYEPSSTVCEDDGEFIGNHLLFLRALASAKSPDIKPLTHKSFGSR